MKTQTKAEASNKFCPFLNDYKYCQLGRCMAWVEIYGADSREDHSGGAEWMRDLMLSRKHSNQRVQKNGNGCNAVLSLESEGICSRVYKNHEQAKDET